MISVKRISASKKPVHADNMASGGTAEEMIIPVRRNRNCSGIMFDTMYARNGEIIKSPKLTIIGYI